jgi:hypothetical protein
VSVYVCVSECVCVCAGVCVCVCVCVCVWLKYLFQGRTSLNLVLDLSFFLSFFLFFSFFLSLVWCYISSRAMPSPFEVSRSCAIRRTPHSPPPLSRTHARTHARTQAVGLLKERSAGRSRRYLHSTEQTQATNIHALSGIRTLNPSNRAGSDLHLRQFGHRDRPVFIKVRNFLIIRVINDLWKTLYMPVIVF